MTQDEAVRLLNELRDRSTSSDNSEAHEEADELIERYLRESGQEAVATAYREVEEASTYPGDSCIGSTWLYSF